MSFGKLLLGLLGIMVAIFIFQSYTGESLIKDKFYYQINHVTREGYDEISPESETYIFKDKGDLVDTYKPNDMGIIMPRLKENKLYYFLIVDKNTSTSLYESVELLEKIGKEIDNTILTFDNHKKFTEIRNIKNKRDKIDDWGINQYKELDDKAIEIAKTIKLGEKYQFLNEIFIFDNIDVPNVAFSSQVVKSGTDNIITLYLNKDTDIHIY